MTHIITVTNNKGGVGKTSLTVNLSYELSKEHKVLVLDLDPQRNCTSCLLNEQNSKYTILNNFKKDRGIKDTIVKTEYNKLYLIPGDLKLAYEEKNYFSSIKGFNLLRNLLKDDYIKTFDYIIIDTCPSLNNIYLTSALLASDFYVIPCFPEGTVVDGVTNIISNISEEVIPENENLMLLGLVVTKFDKQSANDKAYIKVLNQIAKETGIKFFQTMIPFSKAIPSSLSMNRPLEHYMNSSSFKSKTPAVTAFNKFAKEISNECQRLTQSKKPRKSQEKIEREFEL